MIPETILNVQNLSVSFGTEKILRDISFSVKKGEALAVIGPNGAGKSVLFRSLVGLLPYQGSIVWKRGIKIGYAAQKFSVDRLMPLTVREFFLLKSRRFWLPSREFVEHLAAHELTLAGLDEKIFKKQLGKLSGGETQRVIIAWTMLDHPDALLFDEPTSGIDIGFEETIYHVLRKMQKERGTTILLISHELNVVYKYADNILCLNKEKLCYGHPEDVLDNDGLTRLYGESGFHYHL